MNHRPGRRGRRASASPLFTPHTADRASRKAAHRQLAEALAKAQAEALSRPADAAPDEHTMPAPSTRPTDDQGQDPHAAPDFGSPPTG